MNTAQKVIAKALVEYSTKAVITEKGGVLDKKDDEIEFYEFSDGSRLLYNAETDHARLASE